MARRWPEERSDGGRFGRLSVLWGGMRFAARGAIAARRTAFVACCGACLVGTLPVGARAAEEDEPLAEGERQLPEGLDRLFVPQSRMADSPQTRAAFRDVVVDAQRATVSVHVDGQHRALGCVVGAEGWVLTKSSTLSGESVCRLADGREFPAEVVRFNGDYDLALLKIAAVGLPVVRFEKIPEPAVGSWLASVGKGRDPVAVGIVSAAAREIPAERGVLGVQLEESRPLVMQVFADSGADRAGVLVNDLILSVNGQETPTRESLIGAVKAHNPGDRIELRIRRGAEELTLPATLSGSFPGIQNRSEFQNALGGALSVRRFGFPTAIQHDSVLRPADCGGPIVNLDGKVVGLNIARAGRTESYALPAAAVGGLLADWLPAASATPPATPSLREASPVNEVSAAP
jgi:serine protease Do